MESKKISFAFSKSKKPSSVIRSKSAPKEDVQYITSFDGESKNEQKEELIIPVKTNYSVAERIASKRKREEEAGNGNEALLKVDDKDVSLEKLAIQELMNDSKKIPENENSKLSIPLDNQFTEETALAADPDYDSIPVSDFGYAMLRGMGWTPGKGIGKKQEIVDIKIPELRARGLGLGADAPRTDQ